MKKIKIFGAAIFIIILLVQAGCSDDPVVPTNEKETEAIATVTIGMEGGEITADELTLNIPPTAFNTPAEIKIFASSTENPFGENHASKLYKVEGLPLDYTKPLKVSIKYSSDTASNKRVLALGEVVGNTGKLRTAYRLLETIDEDGRVISELPVPEGEQEVSGLRKVTGAQRGVLIFMPQSPFGVYLSSQRHFSVDFLLSLGYDGPAKLGEYLEDAYQKILDLGFSYDARTNWPVRITLRKLATGTDGLTSCSWFGNNYGFIEFNTDLLSDDSKLHITAGHEFFHLVQYLYDSRFGFTKSAYSSRHHWLNEATAAWFEEKFTNESSYTPSVIKGYETSSFKGLQLQPYNDKNKLIENFIEKCYGRTPIIKYLVNNYGEENLVKIFNDIKNGKHPIDAVSQKFPNDWWRRFLQEYILSNVYKSIGRAKWFSNLDGRINVKSEQDKLATYTGDYQDLSAKLYFLFLDYPELEANSQVRFEIAGASKRYLSIFSYQKGNPFELLAEDYNKVDVPNLKQYQQNGWLLAVVSNGKYSDPYTNQHEITLEIKVEESKHDLDLIDECTVKLMTLTDMHYEYSDGTQSDVKETKSLGSRVQGSFTGNTFNGSLKYESNGITFNDTIIATLNSAHDLVTNISLRSLTTYDPAAFGKDSVAMGFSATDIPLFYSNQDNNLLQFRLSGNGVCNILTKGYYKFYSYQRKETLIDYSCDENTFIDIVFKISQ